MNMKKSLIAAAVTGAFAVSGTAMAQPTVYGKVNVGLLSANDDAAVQAQVDNDDAPSVNPDAAGEISLADGASRLGFSGDEDLGNGLTVGYRYEIGINATQMDVADSNRLSWVSLSGDFGEVKAGRMWVGFYNHVGVTADLGDIVAAAPAYYTLGTSVSRVGETVEYTGGTGGVEFTVGGVVSGEAATGDDATAGTDEKEDIDRASVSASFDAGPVNIGVGHVSNSTAASGDPDTSMTGFAVTGSAANLGYGASYVTADRDDDSDSDSPSALDAYVSSDFGGGLSGFLGVSQFDNDMDDDQGSFTSIWGHVDRSLSDRTRLYAEFQMDSYDSTAPNGDDLDPQQIVVGINHDF